MANTGGKQNSRCSRDLWVAVRTGSVQDVEAALTLVKRNNVNIDVRDRYGSTALHIATWRNHVPIAKRLLEAGADPNNRDGESGWGCLHRALHFGHLAVAGILIRSGASLFIEDAKGRIPADLVSGPLDKEFGAREVFSWGNGSNYQLGTGITGIQRVPCRVEALEGLDVVAISAARFHSVAATSRGEVYSWGYARGGRLGHPDFSGEVAVITPRQITSCLVGRRVKTVAAAKHHTIVSTDGGEVFSWGSNREGQLGYPSVDTQVTPRRVSTLKFKVVAIAAANKHSVAITEGGEVFTWGCNKEGQLGYGTSNSASNCVPRCVDYLRGRKCTSVSAAKYHTIVIVDGEVFTWGHKMVTPRRVPITRRCGMTLKFHKVLPFRVCAIAAGVVHSTAVSDNGVAFTWYSADPNLQPNQIVMAGYHVVSVSAGKRRTALTTSTGDVFAWDGQDCVPVRVHGIKHALQLAVGETHSLAITGVYVPVYASKLGAADVSLPTCSRLDDRDSDDELDIEAENSQTEAPKRREPETLMSMCQKVLAEAVIEPKNALQLLELAECVGADNLRLHCEDFVLRNLDYILTVAPAVLGATRPSILAALEKSWDIACWNHRQLPVPSATLPAVVDSDEDDNEVSPRTRKISLAPAGSGTNFMPDGPKTIDERRRAIRKKLQQIESLELKLSKCQTLDKQQIAKLATKSKLLKELDCPNEDNRGKEKCSDNLSTEEPKHQRRRRNKNKATKSLTVKDPSKEYLLETKADSKLETEDVFETKADTKVETKTKEDLPKIKAKTKGDLPETKAETKVRTETEKEPTCEPPKQRKKPKSRKGGLSLFLSGALEAKTTPIVEAPAPVLLKAKGPAWGGALLHKKGPLSLRDIIQSEQEASSLSQKSKLEASPVTPTRSKAVPIAVPCSPQNSAAPWLGAVSPGSVPSLRDIQMQQVKQKEKQRPLGSRPPPNPLTVGSSSTPPEPENCWFKPDSASGRSSIRCIQIEEKAMKDLRRMYTTVKIIQD